MALNKLNDDLNILQGVPDQPDATNGYPASKMKELFDKAGNVIKDYINTKIIDILNSVTDGVSGADNIAATLIQDIEGETVQAILESFRNKLKSIQDGFSGADFIRATTIQGLDGNTVQGILESLKLFADDLQEQIDSNDIDISNLGKNKAEKTYVDTQDQSLQKQIDTANTNITGLDNKKLDKSTYNAQVINAGNSNAEIVDARGTSAKLKDRLDGFDSSLADKANQTDLGITNQNVAQKANQSDLNDTNSNVALKADKTYVDTKIASVASGSPKGIYATLSELQTAYPSGNSNIYVVIADGGWYYWNGSAWTKGGTYQSTGIAEKSVTKAQLDDTVFDTIAKGDFIANSMTTKKNLFDNSSFTPNKDLSNSDGSVVSSSTNGVSDYFIVKPGTNYIANDGGNIVFYDRYKNFISPRVGITPKTTFVSPSNAYYARVAINNNGINTFQIEQGTVATTYEKFKYVSPKVEIANTQINGDIVVTDKDWNNILINGNMKTYQSDGVTLNKWNTSTSIQTVKENDYTKLVIDTTSQYPTLSTMYYMPININHKYALFYDFEVLSYNCDGYKLGLQLWQAGSVQVSDLFLKDFLTANTKNKGIIFVTPKLDSTAANMYLNIRGFTNVPSGANYQLQLKINCFMILDLGDSTNHIHDFTESELLEGINNRAGYAEGYLNNLLNARMSDRAISATFAESVTSTWKDKNFVSYGDSTVAMEHWQPFVVEKLQFGKHTPLGIGGAPIEMMNNPNNVQSITDRNNNSYTQDWRINQIPGDTDLVIVFGGFNDVSIEDGAYRFHSVPFGDGDIQNEALNLDPTNMQGAIGLMIKKMLARCPKARIVICSPPWGFDRPQTGTLKKISVAMEEAAKFYGMSFVNLHDECGYNYLNRDNYIPVGDQVHFDDNLGGKRIAEIIIGKLRSIEPME